MPRPKKMVLAHILGWGGKEIQKHTPPHPLPSTGQIKEICGWAAGSGTFYLCKSAWELLNLFLVPSSLFRGKKKKKKPQQLRIPEGDAGVKSQRAHRDLFQSVVQGTMSPPGGPLGYRADSVASKPDLLALLTSEPGSEWRL